MLPQIWINYFFKNKWIWNKLATKAWSYSCRVLCLAMRSGFSQHSICSRRSGNQTHPGLPAQFSYSRSPCSTGLCIRSTFWITPTSETVQNVSRKLHWDHSTPSYNRLSSCRLSTLSTANLKICFKCVNHSISWLLKIVSKCRRSSNLFFQLSHNLSSKEPTTTRLWLGGLPLELCRCWC